MTAADGQPFNVARDGSQVGVQAQYIDTITFQSDILTVSQNDTPEAKYKAGVENLKSGNPRRARELIWDAMMSDHARSEVLCYWLVAMLSGRTVRHFSTEEIDQLKRCRSRCPETPGDAWADGIQLIYRLLDSVLPSLSGKQQAAKTDMSLLLKQFDGLGVEQRDMIRPHLELFLTGPRQDEMWQRGYQRAQFRQLTDDRLGRAWMFFQPIPAEVSLPPPRPEWISAATRLAMRANACLFVLAAGYLGWELLWHKAFLSLLAYVAALASGAIAAPADLEWRFLTGRRREKEEQFKAAPGHSGDELTDRVDKLFKRYFSWYMPDKTERERWESATAGLRQFYRDETIGICRDRGVSPNEVAWFIRYEIRDLKRRWQDETLDEYRRDLLPRPGMVAARWAGLAVLFFGGVWAAVALRAHPLTDVVALVSAFWGWRFWLRINLERRRYAADADERSRRQAAIDKEFRRWSEKLEARPKDADMAAWLALDRTILLGRALDHFRLFRSRLIAYAFLEEPGVAVRRARITDGPMRYAGYRLLMFLLAEDGVRQVRATLDFMTGTLTIRERTSYRYDAIVAVRVSRESRGAQTFELRLGAGDPITVRVRDVSPDEAQQDVASTETEEATEIEEATALDVTSVIDLLHMLEGVAGEGRTWFRGRGWTEAWRGNDGEETPPSALFR